MIAAGLALLAVAGCDRRELQFSEEDTADLIAFAPGMTAACVEKARMGGIEAISSLAVEECYDMGLPRRLRGLWRNDFEGSRFCPEPATDCGYDAPGDEIWLSYSRNLRPQQNPREGDGGLYQIEFFGRMTATRGHYGHAGMSNHEAVVDEVISIRPSANTSQPD